MVNIRGGMITSVPKTKA